MSDDYGESEFWRDYKAAVREHRHKMLGAANTEGWTAHTTWHFSRTFAGHIFDWWPSGGKARYRGRMTYGHSRVNSKIKQLKEQEAMVDGGTLSRWGEEA